MIFNDNGRNQLYDNLVVNDELKSDMLKACMKIQKDSSLQKDSLSLRRNEKMKKKSLYGSMIKNVSVAVLSVALSGALIVGALNHIKKKNVGGGSPVVGKESIEVTTDGVTKVLETTTEFESETEVETPEVTTEGKESMYGSDKDIKSAIDQFSGAEDVWKNVFAGGTGEVKYAMTDLDHNGDPEVIVATMEGSGRYTKMKVFELVKGDVVDRTQGDESNTAMGPGTCPDITLIDELPTYYNGARYIYVASDITTVKDGGEVRNFEDKCEFLLENGTFGCNVMASKESTGYEDTNCKYKDFNDKTITKDEFENYDKNKYNENEGFTRSVTKIKWTNLTDGNVELVDSYKTFLGRE